MSITSHSFYKKVMSENHRNNYYQQRQMQLPSGPLPTEREVTGEVMRIVYANNENGYSVVRLRRLPVGEEVTLAGNLGGALEGMVIKAAGQWVDNPSFGRQFQVESTQAVLPRSTEGIQRYLASGLFPGINKKYAAAIVERFGQQTLEILDNYPERLAEVRGIGKKKVAAIRKSWAENTTDRESKVFLQGLGISPIMSDKIIKHYKEVPAVEVVRRNPYRLASDVEGIGFRTADVIAFKMGVERNSLQRLTAGIVFALDQASLEGHVCLERQPLIDKACQLLQVDSEDVAQGLEAALTEGAVIAEYVRGATPPGEHYYYHPKLRQAEVELAEALNLLLACQLVSEAERQSYAASTTTWQERGQGSGSVLDEFQERAKDLALSSPISIITGGPGVGKTTVISQIVKEAHRRKWHVSLAAPTGRAARRLAESTGQEAKTIHRLLQFDPEDGHFYYGLDHPLPCDFLIVDEVSMLDVFLARDLFQAIAPGTRVLLVGDRDQLPSVGPGAVLHDLIASGRIPVTELRRIYRQAAGSRIITSAHQVNSGVVPDLINPPKGTRGDFYYYEIDDGLQAAEYIRKLTANFIPNFFGMRPMDDIQILTPMRKGECGTNALNEALQESLNPPAEDKPELTVTGTPPRIFRLGDRVMQMRNNYDKGVFNGEMGFIASVNCEARTFKVLFDLTTVEYGEKDFEQLQLAYAITIHKSQGSEFPVVIMPLLNQHYVMLQRNLLYTGMTRAKKLYILVGCRKAISYAIDNNHHARRLTALVGRLGSRTQRG